MRILHAMLRAFCAAKAMGSIPTGILPYGVHCVQLKLILLVDATRMIMILIEILELRWKSLLWLLYQAYVSG